MAKHLTDRQRKKIIADYVECGSYNAVAKKHKVSATTVKNTVLKDKNSVEKCEQKKNRTRRIFWRSWTGRSRMFVTSGFEYEEREIIIGRSGKQTGKVRVRKRYQPPNMEALFMLVQQEE